MAVYYFLPDLVGILLGIALVTFLIKALQIPNATLLKATIFITLTYIAVNSIFYIFPDNPFSLILVFAAQLAVIKLVFNPKPSGIIIFFFIGLIFPLGFKLILVEPITQIFVDFLF
ncbi:hypothetical protein IIC68_02520 [archaeon]|nr:hypothetical protein [archaeon]